MFPYIVNDYILQRSLLCSHVATVFCIRNLISLLLCIASPFPPARRVVVHLQADIVKSVGNLELPAVPLLYVHVKLSGLSEHCYLLKSRSEELI